MTRPLSLSMAPRVPSAQLPTLPLPPKVATYITNQGNTAEHQSCKSNLLSAHAFSFPSVSLRFPFGLNFGSSRKFIRRLRGMAERFFLTVSCVDWFISKHVFYRSLIPLYLHLYSVASCIVRWGERKRKPCFLYARLWVAAWL